MSSQVDASPSPRRRDQRRLARVACHHPAVSQVIGATGALNLWQARCPSFASLGSIAYTLLCVDLRSGCERTEMAERLTLVEAASPPGG